MSNPTTQDYRTSTDMLAALEAEDAAYFQRECKKSPEDTPVKIVTVPERGFAI